MPAEICQPARIPTQNFTAPICDGPRGRRRDVGRDVRKKHPPAHPRVRGRGRRPEACGRRAGVHGVGALRPLLPVRGAAREPSSVELPLVLLVFTVNSLPGIRDFSFTRIDR